MYYLDILLSFIYETSVKYTDHLKKYFLVKKTKNKGRKPLQFALYNSYR